MSCMKNATIKQAAILYFITDAQINVSAFEAPAKCEEKKEEYNKRQQDLIDKSQMALDALVTIPSQNTEELRMKAEVLRDCLPSIIDGCECDSSALEVQLAVSLAKDCARLFI